MTVHVKDVLPGQAAESNKSQKAVRYAAGVINHA